MTKIHFDKVERKLELTSIYDAYKVGQTLRIITDDGVVHKLPLTEMLAKLGVDLTGLELVACSAVGDWLTFDTRPMVSIYELAKRAVEERADCFPDETIIIWEGEDVKVRMYRSQDSILMDLTNGKPREAERVQVGLLTPSSWRFTLTMQEYEAWVKRARRLV